MKAMITSSKCVMLSKPFKKSGNSTQEINQKMEVQGSHRTLLYRQPFKKQMSNFSTVVVDLEGNSKEDYFEAERKEKKEKPTVVITLPVKSEKMATKGTQTDFRESEAQTFPWRHQIQAGEELLAELLSLDWFNLEKNFPPGRDEVMLVEQTRQKLSWENIIEKLKGKENEMMKKSLVLRMYVNETTFRESKKEEENRERLERSRREWEGMKRIFEEELSSKLLRTYVCRKRENDTKFHYWNHQLARKIRKVKSAKSAVSTKPDIITLHKDKSSALYAPKLRDGASLGHEVIDIHCRFLKRFHGLEILEKHMAHVLHLKLSKPAKKTKNSKSKKLEFSVGEFIGKENCGLEENSSIKIAVPATTPEPAATSRTEILPSNDE